MKAIGDMTEAELAAFVQQHLAAQGIRVVLSGGTCVRTCEIIAATAKNAHLAPSGAIGNGGPKRRF